MIKRAITVSLLTALLCLMSLIGCAPQVSDGGDEAAKQDKVASFSFEWAADSDCATCHASHSATVQADVHSTAAEAKDMGCMACHADSEGLDAAHEGVSMGDKEPKRLKSTEVASETCLGCHDKAEVIASTAELTVLTDANGTTINPHDMPEVESHADVGCVDCHNIHDDQTTQEAASGYCIGCHHHEVYECYTCHD